MQRKRNATRDPAQDSPRSGPESSCLRAPRRHRRRRGRNPAAAVVSHAMPPIAHTVFAQDARRLRLDTLVRLRWLSVIGQSAAVAGVHFGFGSPLPLWACFAVIAAAAALNLGLRLRYPASYRLREGAAEPPPWLRHPPPPGRPSL